MALIQEGYLRNLAVQKVRSDSRYRSFSTEAVHDSLRKSLLMESSQNFSSEKMYDIFVSHSFSDKELVLGLKIELENFGYSVYVDWIEDYGLDRCNVTQNNVRWIQARMKASKCLLYATSSNSSNSKWMPWELGFMDGLKNKVAIFPISGDYQNSYSGTEYLGIYPFLEKATSQTESEEILWVTDQIDKTLYAPFDLWLNNGILKRHTG